MTYAFGGITLSKPPATPLDPDGSIEDCLLRTPTDAGYVQTRPKFTRARRSWGLQFVNMPSADLVSMRTYEQVTLVNGAAIFTWVHPITGTFTVQLKGPIAYSRPHSGSYGDMTLTLQEV